MAFLVISVKFGKHRPLPKRKEDAEKENYKRQNDICRSKCRNSDILLCTSIPFTFNNRFKENTHTFIAVCLFIINLEN